MQRIKISEQDLTNNVTALAGDDIVFVPGFADPSSSSEEYTGVPILCQSLAEFVEYFGPAPVCFTADQLYNSLPSQFADVAIPSVAQRSVKVTGEEVTIGSDGFAVAAHKPIVENTLKDDAGTVFTNIDLVNGKFNWTGAKTGDKKTVSYTYTVTETSPVLFYKNDPDPGYIYAKELLAAGLQVVYYRVNESLADVTAAKMYTELVGTIYSTSESPLLDKGTYSVKYLTTGGYPNFEYPGLASAMATIADGTSGRGDCIALIDHTFKAERPLKATNESSVFYCASKGTNAVKSSYAAMYTPWAKFVPGNSYENKHSKEDPKSNVLNLDGSINMPGSFAFLECLASSVAANPNWLVVAGVSRGLVSNIAALCTNEILTNKIADSYAQDTGVSINPITYIRPYGYTIWGNRTLMDYNEASQGFATRFVNIRGICSDVKKRAFRAAQSLMFEQNNDILWINFKSMIRPLLDQMVSGYGLKGYKFVKLDSDDKTKLRCNIKITPQYAVESFDIGIVLTDEDLTVTE